ncbi:putative reverse transcriptase domain-containing protein, partial [Tanacetum coccineum]
LCAPKCTNCKRIGHSARDCRSQPAAANNNQRSQRANQRVLICFECGAQGYFKNNCPKLRNKNQGNQVGNGNAMARAYGVGTAGTNLNSNVVMGTFLLNNRYASILFDTGADKSFVFTAFSFLIDIIPTTLDYVYDVELANELETASKPYTGQPSQSSKVRRHIFQAVSGRTDSDADLEDFIFDGPSHFMILEDLGSIIDNGLSEVVLGKPFAQTSKLTYDESLGLIRFALKDDEGCVEDAFKGQRI